MPRSRCRANRSAINDGLSPACSTYASAVVVVVTAALVVTAATVPDALVPDDVPAGVVTASAPEQAVSSAAATAAAPARRTGPFRHLTVHRLGLRAQPSRQRGPDGGAGLVSPPGAVWLWRRSTRGAMLTV